MAFSKIFCAVLTTSVLALPMASLADDRADIQVRYDTLKTIIASQDGPAFQAMVTPDFQSVDVSGQTEDSAQMISDLAALKPDANKKSQTTLTAVQVDGDTARVEQTYEMTTQKVGADGQAHAVHFVAQSSDVWRRVHAVWLMASTRTNQMDYEIDGKSVMHKQRAS